MRKLSLLWTMATDVFQHPGLHRDALFTASATIVSGLGSLIYWKLITLRFSVEMVGLTSAAIASATFLGSLSNLGLTAGLVRFLPHQTAAQKSGLIRAAVWISLSIGTIAGFTFLAGRDWWSPDLIPPQTGPVYMVIFMALLVTLTQVNTNTAVIMAERRTPHLVMQSMIINIIQIAGGWLIAVNLGVSGVLFTYMLPILVVAVGFYFILPRIIRYSGAIPAIDKPLLRDLLRYAFSTQVFNVIWQLPAFIFPLMILARLGAEASAGLALTWYAYSFLAIIPNATMVALLVDGSYEPGQLSRRLWDALLVNLAVLTPLVLLVAVFAPWLLGFFGSFYAHSALLLRLLTFSILPLSINGLFITLWRVRKQMLYLNLFTVFLTFGSIALSYLFVAPLGLDGVGWGWLAGQTSFALVTLILILRERWLAPVEIS